MSMIVAPFQHHPTFMVVRIIVVLLQLLSSSFPPPSFTIGLLPSQPPPSAIPPASPLAICSSRQLSPARRRLPCEATGRRPSIATTPSHPTPEKAV
ncbi:unnamed protein product [Lactuca virosa]|uniref:Uncharacterized protein n=1 Tax=Lactuca virosa TaxID=75947 RepID=A0AAU9PTN2_9ASTR|nr:unnamed protein product [Lactuca virosa]